METQQTDLSTILNWLQSSDVCQGLMDEQLEDIARRAVIRTFNESEYLSRVGDRVDEFWVIVEGSVESYIGDTHAHSRVLGILGPGDQIGDVALLEDSTRLAGFRAQTNGKMLVISAADFFHLIETQPVLIRNLFFKLTARYKEALGMPSRRTVARHIAVIAPTEKARVLAGRFLAKLQDGGETLTIVADRSEPFSQSSGWTNSLHFAPRLAENSPGSPPSSQANRHISLFASEHWDDFDFRKVKQHEEILWLLEPHMVDGVLDVCRDAFASDQFLRKKSRLVFLLDNETPVARRPRRTPFELPPVMVHVETNRGALTRLEVQGLDRLTRALRGVKLGIALAGGGAKGMAHLGVLQALDEAGINFDAMSGSSAGAMIGVVYAAGIAPDTAVKHFQTDLTPSRLFQKLPSWPNLYLLGQFRRRAWDGMLRPYLFDWRLEELPIPFTAMTVDLVEGRPVTRQTGDAIHAILESINLPVLARPILREGMVLVDGAMLNNLPADVLANDGCDFVVGVDVSRRMNHEFAGNRPDTPLEQMNRPGTLETMLRIFESQAHKLSVMRNRAIDFWITPDTSPFGLADFYRTSEIAQVGYEATQRLLPELKLKIEHLI